MNFDSEANLRSDVERWAEGVIRAWENQIVALRIGSGSPRTLARRFEAHVVWHAGGDIRRIEFAFAYYLKFVNWGVGRGVTIDNRDTMIAAGLTVRRPKPWYHRVFFSELKHLQTIVARKLGENVTAMIVRNVEDNADGHIPGRVG